MAKKISLQGFIKGQYEYKNSYVRTLDASFENIYNAHRNLLGEQLSELQLSVRINSED